MTVIHIVTVETVDHDEAIAIRDILRDLGFEATLTSRATKINASALRDTRMGRLVLRYMQPGRIYHLDGIQELLYKNEFSPNSAGAVLTRLTEEGDIYRLDRGAYVKRK